MPQDKDRIILGIDPGTTLMGYGIIRAGGKAPVYLDMGVINLKPVGDGYLKLRKILESTQELMDRYTPDEVAIEAPFFGKNVQSMLKLGRAQGVAIAAVLSRDIPVWEYAPRKIKLAITGAGQASKEQVAGMLSRMFGISDMPDNLDATDGLAVAVCHFYQKDLPDSSSGPRSWEAYIRKNPGRIR